MVSKLIGYLKLGTASTVEMSNPCCNECVLYVTCTDQCLEFRPLLSVS